AILKLAALAVHVPAHAPTPPPHPARTRSHHAAPASNPGHPTDTGTPTAASRPDRPAASGSADPAATSCSPLPARRKEVIVLALANADESGGLVHGDGEAPFFGRAALRSRDGNGSP